MKKTMKNELISRLRRKPGFDAKQTKKVLDAVCHEQFPTANRKERRRLMNGTQG